MTGAVRTQFRGDGLLAPEPPLAPQPRLSPEPGSAPPAIDLLQWARRFSWAVRPALVYALSRACVLLAAGVAVILSPSLTLGGALVRWDSGYYVDLAKAGYPHLVPMVGGHVIQNTTAFFPLFPLSIKELSTFTWIPPVIGGLLLSSGFGLLAALMVWLLARDLWDEAVANRVCWLFCLFPGSFVFSMVYAEGLLIALAAACILALRRQRWLVAGVLAALATATRPNAIALGAACAWVAACAMYRRREWRALLAPALAPVGILAYLGYLWIRTGSPTVWFTTENQGWHEGFDLTATWTRIAGFVNHPQANLNDAVGLACLAFVILAGIVLVRNRLPGELVAYAGVIIALTLVSRLYGTTPRFLLTAFPLVMALGYRLRGIGFVAAVAASATAMGWLMVVTASSYALTP